MKRLAVLLLLVSVSTFGYCPDFSVNSFDCLYRDSDSWPKYSNGVQFSVGEKICLGFREDAEEYEYVKQGIPVVLRAHRKICREIVNIEQKTRIDRACCASLYTKDTKRYNECVEADYGYCYNIKFYRVEYSRELMEDAPFDERLMTWNLKEDPNFVRMGDSIDVFRKDGTLMYRGFFSLKSDAYGVSEPVRTSGYCYDKKGKQTKRVNNVSACK